jgi:hypothetical protein
MASTLEYIDLFNRKERFFLFNLATSNSGEAGTMTLASRFRRALGRAIGMNVPADAKAYVDYHLDWLHAAVVLGISESTGPFENGSGDEGHPRARVSNGTQEDIDLVVTFDADGQSVVVMVEAKGDTSWTNKQMESKAKRLRAIFGEVPPPGINPVFCLVSPSRPTSRLRLETWPSWMVGTGKERPNWMELSLPPGRLKVTGCDKWAKPSHLRTHWMVERAGPKDAAS